MLTKTTPNAATNSLHVPQTDPVAVSPDDRIQLQCSTEIDLLGDVSAATVAQTSDSSFRYL